MDGWMDGVVGVDFLVEFEGERRERFGGSCFEMMA